MWVLVSCDLTTVILTILTQVPKQSNTYDCGIYAIYFIRALVEAPTWIKGIVKQQMESERLIESRGGPRSKLALERWVSYMWGLDVEILRSWIRITLLAWLEHGTPHGEPIEIDSEDEENVVE